MRNSVVSKRVIVGLVLVVISVVAFSCWFCHSSDIMRNASHDSGEMGEDDIGMSIMQEYLPNNLDSGRVNFGTLESVKL